VGAGDGDPIPDSDTSAANVESTAFPTGPPQCRSTTRAFYYRFWVD